MSTYVFIITARDESLAVFRLFERKSRTKMLSYFYHKLNTEGETMERKKTLDIPDLRGTLFSSLVGGAFRPMSAMATRNVQHDIFTP